MIQTNLTSTHSLLIQLTEWYRSSTLCKGEQQEHKKNHDTQNPTLDKKLHVFYSTVYDYLIYCGTIKYTSESNTMNGLKASSFNGEWGMD